MKARSGTAALLRHRHSVGGPGPGRNRDQENLLFFFFLTSNFDGSVVDGQVASY